MNIPTPFLQANIGTSIIHLIDTKEYFHEKPHKNQNCSGCEHVDRRELRHVRNSIGTLRRA
jgi:hypothetical protein